VQLHQIPFTAISFLNEFDVATYVAHYSDNVHLYPVEVVLKGTKKDYISNNHMTSHQCNLNRM
jgi:hypothetical protein